MSVEAQIYCKLIKHLFLICRSVEKQSRVRGRKRKKINLEVKGEGT